MSDKKTAKIENRSFLQIKKELDASKSYIIFENEVSEAEGSVLKEDSSIVSWLLKEDMKWDSYVDQEQAKEYLVVQINPGKEDQTLGKIMGKPFSNEMAYYLYKARTE